MAELRTRAPSGVAPWPIVLVDAEEKAGGTYCALSVASAVEVDRTFVVDFDGTADGYADLGEFELVDHNGTLEDVVNQIAAASTVTSEPGKVNVLVVDQVSTLWQSVVAWGATRVRRGAKYRDLLASDPTTPVEIPKNVWADVDARWRSFIDACRAFPGPVVWVARGGVDDDGRWRVNVERTLRHEATVWVRLHRDPRTAVLMGCAYLTGPVDVGDVLPLERTLDHVLFEMLEPVEGYGPRSRTAALPVSWTREMALSSLAERCATVGLSRAEADAEAARLWDTAGLGDLRTVSPAQWRQLVALVGTSPDQQSDGPDGNAARPAAGPGDPGGEVEPSAAAPSPPAPTPDSGEEVAA